MRLWSLHPGYLDRAGLTALWREGLLAQKVLLGETKGYKNHPQLERFRRAPDPAAAIGSYLTEVWNEALRRGYRFNRDKIRSSGTKHRIKVNRGQLEFELAHLKKKLMHRDPVKHREVRETVTPRVNPLFKDRPGGIEDWEKTNE